MFRRVAAVVVLSIAFHAYGQSLTLGHLAGAPAGPGTSDGSGGMARFREVADVAADSAGNLYVADENRVRKITPAGVVSTLAGAAGQTGFVNATGAAARFDELRGVAVDGSGNIYVADRFPNSAIRKITPAGVVTTLVRNAFGAPVFDPIDLVIDGAGNVHFIESASSEIAKVTPSGVLTRTDTELGDLDAIAIDAQGTLYVAVSCTIQKVSPTGVVTPLAGSFGQSGSSNGTGTTARFSAVIFGLVVDGAGNVYVSDGLNYTIRKVTPGGEVTTIAGLAGTTGDEDGAGTAARFRSPVGLTVSNGNVYVTDRDNYGVRRIAVDGTVTTIAGGPGGSAYGSGNRDGAGGTARFSKPTAVAMDSAGAIYVADHANFNLRKITPAGVVTTYAGRGCRWADGLVGTAVGSAEFAGPQGIAIDAAGNLYVSENRDVESISEEFVCDSSHRIRKITPQGVVSTLAGSAVAGSADGPGATATFRFPQGLAVDANGNVFVADAGNQTIRKIDPQGTVTTYAGAAGSSGSADGPAATARFNQPMALTVDPSGNLYVADQLNHTIRRISASGQVTTLAGSAGLLGPTDGTGSAARFNSPSGITIDATGNLYVSDTFNHTIRRITPAGVVTTVAGQAGAEATDDGPGLVARFHRPSGLAMTGSSLFIADRYNHAIRTATVSTVPFGDVNGDGLVTVTDIFYLVSFLFSSGASPVGPGDPNGDSSTTVSDVFYLVNHLFAGGPAPRG